MAGLPVTVDLDAYRGDTWAQTFRFRREDELVDLSGASVACWAEHGGEQLQLVAEVTGLGEITISLPAVDVEAHDYRYDVEVTGSAGDVTTWVAGRLRIRQDVTNAP